MFTFVSDIVVETLAELLHLNLKFVCLGRSYPLPLLTSLSVQALAKHCPLLEAVVLTGMSEQVQHGPPPKQASNQPLHLPTCLTSERTASSNQANPKKVQ